MSHKLHLRVDFRVICAVLLLIMVVMLALWRPWHDNSPVQRKITVVGTATIEAEPDYYRFGPTYQLTGSNRELAHQRLNSKINDIIEQLKELGVDESDIELNANSYEQYYIRPTGGQAVTAHLAVRVSNKELAQKVQDYLITTSPTGSVTPRPDFSDEKRKSLENEARDKAVADAREQAERTARQLNAKLGKVIEVKDVAGNGMVTPFDLRSEVTSSEPAMDSGATLPVLPGRKDATFSVEATFEIR